jgi:3-deoxy-7-phosphoheptulonate synthase
MPTSNTQADCPEKGETRGGLPSPAQLRLEHACSAVEKKAVAESKRTVKRILCGEDPRLLVIVGPCSISDVATAREYADRLRSLAGEVEDKMYLVMRAYFQKPRTKLGWKGLMFDPFLDGSNKMREGLSLARGLLCELARMGVPAASEALDPLAYEYIEDLVSWTAIGARTCESQVHREYASGLSSAVGFKNAVNGDIEAALNGATAARSKHTFLTANADGGFAQRVTSGNPYAHLVLRGGRRPNYSAEEVARCIGKLEEYGLPRWLVIDCSHGNSGKNASNQPLVFADCIEQKKQGNRAIKGLMLESNLYGGSQKMPANAGEFIPGVSVTDACISWEATRTLLLTAAERLHKPPQMGEESTIQCHYGAGIS